MQGLIGAASLGWGVVALPYTVHGGDEILWTVRGVVEETNGSEVANVILKNLEAVWGVGSLVGCWVENKGSAYVVVRVIPEREWLSNKGGVQGLVDGNPGIMWGPRQPTVTNRVWNRVDVKVEIMTAEAAKVTVVRGLVYCGTRRTVHMAAGGGGASVLRQGLQTSTVGIGVRRPLATRATAYGPLRVSGVSAQPVGACFQCKKNGHWKNECPDGPGCWSVAVSYAGYGDISAGSVPGGWCQVWDKKERLQERREVNMAWRRREWDPMRGGGWKLRIRALMMRGYGRRWRRLTRLEALRVHDLGWGS